MRAAIEMMTPEWAWTIADDRDGSRREGAQVAEMSLVLTEAWLRRAGKRRERVAEGKKPSGGQPRTWPEGMRVIV